LKEKNDAALGAASAIGANASDSSVMATTEMPADAKPTAGNSQAASTVPLLMVKGSSFMSSVVADTKDATDAGVGVTTNLVGVASADSATAIANADSEAKSSTFGPDAKASSSVTAAVAMDSQTGATGAHALAAVGGIGLDTTVGSRVVDDEGAGTDAHAFATPATATVATGPKATVEFNDAGSTGVNASSKNQHMT